MIAKYLRLSVEDERSESLSIPNQRKILNRHLESLDIPNAEFTEFVDNGYTGTNMERPAMQELLELVRGGRIQVIAVKDFSRFSRSSLDSGYFIEQVFPLYGVRFISVSDNFDSEDYKGDTGGIDVAFKFLMHEYYSKDLSMKIKSAFRVKKLSGEAVSGSVPFGYRLSNIKRLEPNPETADIVRLIFKMALEGQSTATIRNTLTQNKIPTPREALRMSRGDDAQPECRWRTGAVAKILRTVQYTGVYIGGKYSQVAVGSKQTVITAPDEWIMIPDNHPAIISKEDFDRIQNAGAEKGNSCVVEDKTVKRRMKRDGSSMILPPLYGYVFDKKHEPIINTQASKAICAIFEYTLGGLNVPQICEKLTEAGFPTPGEQKALDRGESITLGKAWARGPVKRILRELQYTGVAVSGRFFADTKPVMPQKRTLSECTLTPNARPAIITDETFNAVQEILAKRPKKTYTRRNYLLKGKVRCGCCGRNLIYDNGQGYPSYRCQYSNGDITARCHKLNIIAKELDEVVMSLIRKQAEVVLNSESLSDLRKVGTERQKVVECENTLKQCIEERQSAYEQFVLREIDRETYLSLKADCTAQIDKLNNQIAVIKQAERDRESVKKAIDLAQQIVDESLTPQEVVETLIDKILVFPDKELETQLKVTHFANID
jgi:DNA invertase Pin-like site-specific DNA recombinase